MSGGWLTTAVRHVAAVAIAGALIVPLSAHAVGVAASTHKTGGTVSGANRDPKRLQQYSRPLAPSSPSTGAVGGSSTTAPAPTPSAPAGTAPSEGTGLGRAPSPAPGASTPMTRAAATQAPAAPAEPVASSTAAPASDPTPLREPTASGANGIVNARTDTIHTAPASAASTPGPSDTDQAVGFGAAATGGAGQQVVEVSNLRDNPEDLSPWPGSLRAALAGGNRIVRFSVSGSIHLLHPLRVKYPNVTIDGSDAPNGGVALYGSQLVIDADNVIVRNLRFRGSNREVKVDGLEIGGGSDILIDHVSCSWASDECISLYGYNYTGRGTVRRVTIQNSLLGEAPLDSSYAILIDGDVSDVTLYRNVFAKNANRNPQITTGHRGALGGGQGGGDPLVGVGRYELIQNIIYDAVYGTRIWNQSPTWTIQLDVIGNLWKPGLRYPRPKVPVMIFGDPVSLGPIKVFLSDNLGPGHNSPSEGQPCDYFSRETANHACGGYSPAYVATSRLNRSSAIPGRSAPEDYEEILANAGATLPCRDSLDRKLVAEVMDGTGRYATGPGRLPSLDSCE